MENISPDIILFLVVTGFIAAFIDSVVGGGGLISLPALLLTGLPPTLALGTNKLASLMCSSTSTLSFLRSGKIDLNIIKYLFPLSFIGSALGVITVQQIPSQFLKPMVVVMLIIVTIYTFTRKEWGDTSTYQGMTKKTAYLSGIAAFSIGFYDGFFGPGTGSFLIFGLIHIFGFNFIKASGNAKILNFVSNISALVIFALRGQIYYLIGLPVALSMVMGAQVGTQLALKNGAKLIKPIFVTMSLAVAAKLLIQMH